MSSEPESSREQRFVDHLKELSRREDRAALAALRRGLTGPPGTVISTFAHVARFTEGLHSTTEQAFYLVASLYALHPSDTTDEKNLGGTLASVAQRSESGSIEQRFLSLLNSDFDTLAQPLRQAVSIARGQDVPVNYYQLLRDLRYWAHPEKFIQRRWAETYYRAPLES